MGIVHFLEISLKAKYTNFNTASSLGNDSLFFVYLRIFPLMFSMMANEFLYFHIKLYYFSEFLRIPYPQSITLF